MDKPEKKKIKYYIHDNQKFTGDQQEVGYNQACEDWERFLPSEEEINNFCLPECEELIGTLKVMTDYTLSQLLAQKFCNSLAKAISKRIRGE